MRCVGHKRTGRIKQRTGKIESFLDVHTVGGVRERCSHLLGNGHKKIVEHFQHHRIGIGADGFAVLQRLSACENQVSECINLCLPLRFNDVGAGGLPDNCRPLYLLPRKQGLTIKQRHMATFTGHSYFDFIDRIRCRGR